MSYGTSSNSVPATVLPEGIPTYATRHEEYRWPPGKGPVLLLNNDFDLLWIRRGVMAMDLGSNCRLLAREGDLLLIPPLIAATISQEAGRLIFWFCHFDFRASLRRAQSPAAIPLKLPKRRTGPIREHYAVLNSLIESTGLNAWRQESVLIQMVAALAETGAPAARGMSAIAAIAPRHDPRVAQLRNNIEQNPAAPWRVAQLARSVNLSTGHLHALWANALGGSVKGYIVRARLRLAMARLRERPNAQRPSIKQIAADSGFSSQHLFARQFHGAFGITPSAFRDSAGL